MKKVILFTDGGARNNPGPAGVGIVLTDEKGEVITEGSKYIGEQTNNFAEYEAVFFGLEMIKKSLGSKKLKDLEVEVKLDSQLVAQQLSYRYKIKEPSLFPQFIKIHNMRIKDFPNIIFTHIPRDKNKHADALANEAMDRGK